MNLFHHFAEIVRDLLRALMTEGALPAGLDLSRVGVEPPREAAHGDLACNAAMVLAKAAGQPPRRIAEALAERLRSLPDVAGAEVAGPGFLNLRLADAFWRARLGDVLAAGTAYGDSALGAGRRVNVEYVSANPTGPLHAAHARGAVFGDALARLLAKGGHAVTREYYINDAGAQVETLARTLHLRYRAALGEEIGPIPSGYYPGDYVKDVAAALIARDGRTWLGQEEAAWLEPLRAFAVATLMAEIRADLARIGIAMDVFASERALVDAGRVQEAFAKLEAKGLIYTGILEPPKGKKPDDWEPRPQTLFRATAFGDDVDRPLKKSDGSWTYFANDIAYHYDKHARGFADLVDVWGADHGGYVKRMQAAVRAITDGAAALDVKLIQIVKTLDGGKEVRMSKRAGNFVTLADILDRVGPDVVRFIMLTRRNDQTLDFDYQEVTERKKENPVFYVQYAHARCRSVLRHAAELAAPIDAAGAMAGRVPLETLIDPGELAMIRRMAEWPRVIEGACEAHEPHRVAFYLYDLASDFHAHWQRGARQDTTLRFIRQEEPELTNARLSLVHAIATVIASGLGVIGVVPAEELTLAAGDD